MAEKRPIQASSLRAAIEGIEAALKSGAKLADEFMLRGELSNKLAQLEDAKHGEQNAEQEKKDKTREAAEISYLVEKESRLNEREKEQYASFLSKDYFTKSDFADLSRFYADGGAYDRLTTDGKIQMHHRIEEGIRRGEFTRDEMPAEVERKNEAIRREQASSGKNLVSCKSASDEADLAKNQAGEKSKIAARSSETAITQEALAFEEPTSPVKPSDLPVPQGTHRSPI